MRLGTIIPSLGKKKIDMLEVGTYNICMQSNGEDSMDLKADRLRRIGNDIADLTAEKNIAYGDSASTSSEMLKLLWPTGVPTESYDDALLLVRIWDKMKRIATDKHALGESPYRDIGGYAVLGAEKDEAEEGSLSI